MTPCHGLLIPCPCWLGCSAETDRRIDRLAFLGIGWNARDHAISCRLSARPPRSRCHATSDVWICADVPSAASAPARCARLHCGTAVHARGIYPAPTLRRGGPMRATPSGPPVPRLDASRTGREDPRTTRRTPGAPARVRDQCVRMDTWVKCRPRGLPSFAAWRSEITAVAPHPKPPSTHFPHLMPFFPKSGSPPAPPPAACARCVRAS